ncbi:MAG: hypothetical protein P8Z75_01900 [Gammaproteobacteria bacterium]
MKTLLLRRAGYCLTLTISLLYIYPALAAGPGQASLMPPSPIGKHAAAKFMYGQVMKTMNAGGYTYVQIQSAHQLVWAAGPITPVKKGDAIRISTNMPMRQFHSTALKRNFSLVYFTNHIVVAPGGHTSMAAAGGMKEQMPSSSATAKTIQVKPASHGKTIAEIFEQRRQLKGTQVRVRGEVVKYIGNIMGHNWIHIRDNSSGRTLLVITRDKSQSDVVLVRGTVVLNKDNGIGHVYKVALEHAHILGH